MKKNFMYAGIMDGEIYSMSDPGGDLGYSPLRVALFKSEAAARKKFECVVKIDATQWLKLPAKVSK